MRRQPVEGYFKRVIDSGEVWTPSSVNQNPTYKPFAVRNRDAARLWKVWGGTTEVPAGEDGQ